MELEHFLLQSVRALLSVLDGYVSWLEDDNSAPEDFVFLLETSDDLIVVLSLFDGLIKFGEFVILIFNEHWVSFDIALEFIDFHLESGSFSFWLFFLKMVELLEFNDFLLQRFHLNSEFLNTVKHLYLVLCDFAFLMIIDFDSL